LQMAGEEIILTNIYTRINRMPELDSDKSVFFYSFSGKRSFSFA